MRGFHFISCKRYVWPITKALLSKEEAFLRLVGAMKVSRGMGARGGMVFQAAALGYLSPGRSSPGAPTLEGSPLGRRGLHLSNLAELWSKTTTPRLSTVARLLAFQSFSGSSACSGRAGFLGRSACLGYSAFRTDPTSGDWRAEAPL